MQKKEKKFTKYHYKYSIEFYFIHVLKNNSEQYHNGRDQINISMSENQLTKL